MMKINSLKTSRSRLIFFKPKIPVAALLTLVGLATPAIAQDPFMVKFDVNSAAHDSLAKLQDAGWNFTADGGSAQLFDLQSAPNLGKALVVGGELPTAPRAVYAFEPMEQGMFSALIVSTSSFSNGRLSLEDASGTKLIAHLQIAPTRFMIEAASGGQEDTTFPDRGSINARNPATATFDPGYGIITVRWTAGSVSWHLANYRPDGTLVAEYSNEQATFLSGGVPAQLVLSTSTHNHFQRVFGFTELTLSADPAFMPGEGGGNGEDPYEGLGELIDVTFDLDDVRFDSLEKLEAWGWSFAGQLEEIRDLEGVADINNYLYVGGMTTATPEAILDLGGPVPTGSLNLTLFTRSSGAQGRVQVLDKDMNVLFSFVPQATHRFWVECFGDRLPENFDIPNSGVNDLLNTPRGYSKVGLNWTKEGLTWTWYHYNLDGTINYQEVDRVGSFFRDADPAYLAVRTLWHDNEQRAIGVADLTVTLYEREVALPNPNEREPTPEELAGMTEFRNRLRAEFLRPVSHVQADMLLAKMDAGRFTDLSYNSSADGETHFANLEVLALNYFASNSKYFNDADFLAKVVAGIDFWIDNDYQDWNWWHNFIGFHRRLTPTVIVLAEVLEAQFPQTHAKVVSYFKRVYDGMLVNPRGGGANLTDMSYNAVIGALLDFNIVQLEVSLEQMLTTLQLRSRPGAPINGLYPDMTYFEHGYQLHNASYGHEYLRSSIAAMELVNGSAWDFPPETYQLIERFFLEGVGRMTYGRWFDYNAGGRSITRLNSHQSASGFATTLQRFINLNTGKVDELRALRLRLLNGPTEANHVSATTAFWFGEFISHIRPDYYTSVRLVSERTVRNEIGNDEGLKNRHFGDGINFVLVHGDEYDRLPAIWNYERLPGLTTEQNFTVRPESNWGVTGRNRYAGTLTDGQYGAAAMQLDHDGLRAKKSWFLFDDMVVALGSDINGRPTNTAVFTTLNQTRWAGDIRFSNAGGSTTTIAETQPATRSLGGGSWVWHRDVGYVFPEGNDQGFIEARPVTGNYSDVGTGNTAVSEKVLTLWLNHGLNPQGKGYNYILLPGASEAETAAMSTAPQVQVLQRDTLAHAVYHPGARATGIAFFAPATVELHDGTSISSDKPVLMMLRERLGRLEVSISEPEYRGDTVTITLERELVGEGVVYDSTVGTSTFSVVLPTGDYLGSPVRAIFNLKEEASIRWPDVEQLEDGWKHQPGFGEFFDPFGRPFVYHPTMGFVYLLSDSPESIYIYKFDNTEWYWSAAGLFPHGYQFSTDSWVIL